MEGVKMVLARDENWTSPSAMGWKLPATNKPWLWQVKTPTLQQALRNIGPLPDGTVLLGLGYDRLPVIFDLHNPQPGSFLILSDSQCGKTNLITSALQSAAFLSPGQISLYIIAAEVYNADAFCLTSHHFDSSRPYQPEAVHIINKLAALVQRRSAAGQPHTPAVLLAIDDLELMLAHLSAQDRQTLFWLIHHGAAVRVWTICSASSNSFRTGALSAGLPAAFGTILCGYMQDQALANSLTDDEPPASALIPGVEFCLRSNQAWMRFTLLGQQQGAENL